MKFGYGLSIALIVTVFSACELKTTIRGESEKDTSPPLISISTPITGAYINSSNDSITYTVTGTCSESGRTVTIYADSSAVGSATCAGGVFSCSNVNSTLLAAGAHAFTASISDVALNATTSDPVSVTREVVPPAAATALGWVETSPYSGTTVTASWTVSVSGDLASQSIQYYSNSTCTVTSGSAISLSAVASSDSFTGSNGSTYAYKITSTDTAGNTTTSACSGSMSLDTSAPNAATSLSWSETSPSSSTGVTASWTVSSSGDLSNQKLQFYSDGTCSSTTGGLIDLGSAVTSTYSFSGSHGNTYSYKVTSLDSAGNTTVSGCSSAMVIYTTRIDLFLGTLSSEGTHNGSLANTRFRGPTSIAKVGSDYYVLEQTHGTIRKISSGGTSTLVAGQYDVCGNTNGVGTSATFCWPSGLAALGTDLYISDYQNHTIRKLDTLTNTVSAVAGSGVAGAADGTGAAATFGNLLGMASDGTYLYVADGSRIRKITTAGVVTTVATGLGSAADITYLSNVMYIADAGNNCLKQMPLVAGVPGAVSLLAGTCGGGWGTADGTGAAATMGMPWGITNDGTYIYFNDNQSHLVRRSTVGGVVTTLAGVANTSGAKDGVGTAAKFYNLGGLVASGGSLYIADGGNNAIRGMNTTTLAVTTYAGTLTATGLTNGTGTAARFDGISAVTSSGTDIYIADNYNAVIRKSTAAGVVTTFAGQAGSFGNTDGNKNTTATFWGIVGLVYVGTNLYVLEAGMNNDLRKIDVAGTVSTITSGLNTPEGITAIGTDVYFTDSGAGVIKKVTSAGVVSTLVSGVWGMRGITTDGTSLLIASDYGNTVSSVNVGTGVVTVLAGSSGTSGYVDATGTSARFNDANSITCDGTNVYVSDLANQTIRKVVVASGVVTTFLGVQGDASDVDGPVLSAGISTLNSYKVPLHYSASAGFFVGSYAGVRKITSP